LFTASNSAGIESPDTHSGPDNALRKLWESSSPRLLKPGQHLFRVGDAQRDLYKVESGTVRLYKTFKDGRRQVLAFLFAGEMIGLELQPTHLCNAQAIGSVGLSCVPVTAVRALASDDASLLFELHAKLSSQMVAAQDLALTIARGNPDERLARFLGALLLRRKRQQNGRPIAVDLPMSRTDIADHLGLTIETVSRTLTRLVNRRLINFTRRRSIQIVDQQSLEALMVGHRKTDRRSRAGRVA
jgi:CRP/FNR family transcriptional regulator